MNFLCIVAVIAIPFYLWAALLAKTETLNFVNKISYASRNVKVFLIN